MPLVIAASGDGYMVTVARTEPGSAPARSKSWRAGAPGFAVPEAATLEREAERDDADLLVELILEAGGGQREVDVTRAVGRHDAEREHHGLLVAGREVESRR